MEVKRLDANTLQVVLRKDELNEWGIGMVDLMGDQHQMETFFRDILEEADPDHKFAADKVVIFQVMPTNEGVELLITKQNGDEEEEHSHYQDHSSKQLLEELQGYDQPQSSESANADANSQSDEARSSLKEDLRNGKYNRVVEFSCFDDFEALANVLDATSLKTDLYKYQKRYYMIINFVDSDGLTVTKIYDRLAIVYEYARTSDLTAAFIIEHGQPIIEENALEVIHRYFKPNR